MREFIPNVITPDEATFLAGLRTAKNPKIKHSSVEKIHKAIESLVAANWEPPTYTRLEHRLNLPHEWHKDTGSNDHMAWCKYGCSVVLTNEEGSGYLEYRDGFVLKAPEHYCGLAIHSSDEEHRTQHTGLRKTYLAFLA